MQKLGHLLGLLRRHAVSGQLHKISAKLIFVFINQVFLLLDLIIFILGIILQQGKCTIQILAGFFCHTVHGGMTLGDSQCRVSKETFLQQIKISLLFQVLRIFFDQPEDQLLNLGDKWYQYQDGSHTEDAVHQGNSYRAHGHIHE